MGFKINICNHRSGTPRPLCPANKLVPEREGGGIVHFILINIRMYVQFDVTDPVYLCLFRLYPYETARFLNSMRLTFDYRLSARCSLLMDPLDQSAAAATLLMSEVLKTRYDKDNGC